MFFLLFIAITYYKILQIICILQPFNDHIPYFDLFSQPPFWRQIPQCYHFIFDTSRGRITATAAFCKSSQIFPFCFSLCLFPPQARAKRALLPTVQAARSLMAPEKQMTLTHRLFFIGTIIAYLLPLDCPKP